MNQHSVETRKHLLRIQRQIYKDLKEEVDRTIGKSRGPLARAFHDYERLLRRFEKRVPLEEVLDKLPQCDILYLGDYHTLLQSQKTALRILKEIVAKGRKVSLAIELVHWKNQPLLEAYLREELPEKEFLDAIGYPVTFPFNWTHYKPIFEFAKAESLPIYGINFTAQTTQNSLRSRDQKGAQALTQLISKHPEDLFFVLYGDIHLRKGGLPEMAQKILKKNGVRKRSLILYQNSETLYWKLARLGIENKTEAVRLSQNRYCLMNSTPWVKLQSYLLWLEHGEDLLCTHNNEQDPEEHPHSAFDYSHEIAELAQRITEFLKLPPVNLESFEVHTMEDLRFLDRYASLRKWEIRRWILHSKSCYLPEKRIIYLARLDVNHAAEEAAEFIHHSLSNYSVRDYLKPPYFFHRAWRKALGFFGSKLINPRRKIPTIPKGSPLQEITDHYQRLWNTNQSRQDCGQEDRRYYFEISKHLGYILGEKLFQSVSRGKIPLEEMVSLFRKPFVDPSLSERQFRHWLLLSL